MTAHAKTLDETATVTESFLKTLVKTFYDGIVFNYRAAVDLLLDYTADALPYIARYTAESITFAPETLDGGATTVPLDDEERSADITLPFTFTFFDRAYTTFCIASNGWIHFKDPTGYSYSDYAWLYAYEFNQYGQSPHSFIAGIVKDLDPSAATGSGTVKYQTFGTTPNRIFVIEFSGVAEFDYTGTSDVTFQIQLREADNSIEIHTTSATNADGFNALQWIQGWTGAGIDYDGRGKWTPINTLTEDAVRFALNPSYGTAAWNKNDTEGVTKPTTEEIAAGKLHIKVEAPTVDESQYIKYFKSNFDDGELIGGAFINTKVLNADGRGYNSYYEIYFQFGNFYMGCYFYFFGNELVVFVADEIGIYNVGIDDWWQDWGVAYVTSADYHTIGLVIDTENNIGFLLVDGIVRAGTMLGDSYIEEEETPVFSSSVEINIGAYYESEYSWEGLMELNIDSIQLKATSDPATMLSVGHPTNLTETVTLEIDKSGVLHRNLPGDTLTLTETIINTFGRLLTEVATISESFDKTLGRIFSETLTLTESFIKQWARVLTEALGLTETFTKLRRVFAPVTAETLTLTESFFKGMIKKISETLTLTESFSHLPRKIFSETLALTETFDHKVRKILSEIATLTETFIKQRRSFKVLTETLTLTATLVKKFKLTALEVFTLTDTILRRLNGMIVRWTKVAKDVLGWTKVAKDTTDDWTKQDKDF